MTDQPFGSESAPESAMAHEAPAPQEQPAPQQEAKPEAPAPTPLHEQVPEGAPGFLPDLLRQVEERLRALEKSL